MEEKTKKEYPWKVQWTLRNKRVGELVMTVKPKSVLDIGGGLGELKKYISKKIDYVSIDIEKWTDDTIVADINKELPDIEMRIDAIVVQGTIEYVTNPKKFLEEIKKYGYKLFITYRLDNKDESEETKKVKEDMRARMDENGFDIQRNDYSIVEIENIIKESGWRIVEKIKGKGNERIYYCKKYEK